MPLALLLASFALLPSTPANAQALPPLARAPWFGGPAWGAAGPYTASLRADAADGGSPLWIDGVRPGAQPDGRLAPLPRPGRDAAVYALDLRLSADAAALDGDAEILVPNTSDAFWKAIVFQLPAALLGGEVTVTSALVEGEAVEASTLLDGRALRVPLPRAMLPGDAVVVRLRYRMALPTDGPGHGTLGVGASGVSLAHAYPQLAIYRGPGPHVDGAVVDGFDLDAPPAWGDLVASDAAYYRVRLELPADWQVAAPVADPERREEGGTQVLRFAFGPARDLFLAASPTLVALESQADAVRVRVLAPADIGDGARAVLNVGRDALSVFEGRYGAYPYASLTLVATDTSALGVEFPGIIALNRRLFAADVDPGLRAGVVAHEVAHQWFYGVLGDDQISQPWIDEALAQLATWGYVAEEGGTAAALGFERSLEARWQRERRRPLPVGGPVSAYTPNAYAAIVYGRAPLELGALRERIGAARFDGALRVLVGSHRFQRVDARTVVKAFGSACGCDLSAWADDVLGAAWWRGDPGGVPTGP